MPNKLKNLTYQELLTERERVNEIYNNSLSNYTRKDLAKYIKKLNKEIGERRKSNGS